MVVLSQVAYRSGALADMAALTAAARERGATLIWDLSHSAGAVAVELRAAGAELAVGCTYKYLNGGPGAPAYLYVAAELQAELRSPIWGWFAQSEQFAMDRAYDPVPGIGRFLAGTPPILQLAAVEEGARLTAEAGLERIRAKSVALTRAARRPPRRVARPARLQLGTPRDPQRRGSHVALRHPDAWPITRTLIERAHVIPDFRGPDSIRLGVAPLYTSYIDVWDALDRLRGIVERGEHEAADATRARVTASAFVLASSDLGRASTARSGPCASTSCSGSAVRGGGEGSARTETVSATERVSGGDAPPKSTDDVRRRRRGDDALAPGLDARLLEIVQQVLGLVLEAQDRHLGADLDVGQRDARRCARPG